MKFTIELEDKQEYVEPPKPFKLIWKKNQAKAHENAEAKFSYQIDIDPPRQNDYGEWYVEGFLGMLIDYKNHPTVDKSNHGVMTISTDYTKTKKELDLKLISKEMILFLKKEAQKRFNLKKDYHLYL